MNFQAFEHEIKELEKRDPELAAYVEATGPIDWPMDDDLFSSVVGHILGQQISLKAAQALRARVRAGIVPMTPEHVASLSVSDLKKLGMTERKAEYILNFAHEVLNGTFMLDRLKDMSDQEAIEYLCRLKGVGVWTAEMVLMFGLGRRNVFSWLDIAVRRGLARIHGLPSVSREEFEKCRKLYSPYGSAASMYLWSASHDKRFKSPARKLSKTTSKPKASDSETLPDPQAESS